MTFHEVLWELKNNILGASIEVRIFGARPTEDDEYAPIAGFDGVAESLDETARGAQVRIRMSPRHKSARAFVELAREDFRRAERRDEGDLPWSIHIWQSDIEIAIETYGVGAYHAGDEPVAPEASQHDEGNPSAGDDDIPF